MGRATCPTPRCGPAARRISGGGRAGAACTKGRAKRCLPRCGPGTPSGGCCCLAAAWRLRPKVLGRGPVLTHSLSPRLRPRLAELRGRRGQVSLCEPSAGAEGPAGGGGRVTLWWRRSAGAPQAAGAERATIQGSRSSGAAPCGPPVAEELRDPGSRASGGRRHPLLWSAPRPCGAKTATWGRSRGHSSGLRWVLFARPSG